MKLIARNRSLFIAAGAALLLLALTQIYPAPSPESAKESVVIVDATMEVSSDPFLLFFSRSSNRLDIFENAFVRSPRPSPKSITHYRGTGFVLNGHLITAAHVVTPDSGDKVLAVSITSFHGHSTRVETIRTDKESDLSELAPVEGTSLALPSLYLSATNPFVGQSVVEIGHPGMIHFVISRGQIIGFDSQQNYNVASLDTFGGNSGGPILNDSGEVVGICHTILSGSRFTGIGTLAALRDFLYPERIR